MNKDVSSECYVRSSVLISCADTVGTPFPDAMKLPIDGGYAPSFEPDFKKYISPGEARRMSKLLKRSSFAAAMALEESGIQIPEAIISGTGSGCIENSEKFLADMVKFGESCLKPSLFMQSTHNTIASQTAIKLKAHGYNNTYSQKGISFESALLDAMLRIRTGRSSNVLIGSHDEATPTIAKILKHAHPEYDFVSETSMWGVLTNEEAGSICKVTDIKILHRPSESSLKRIAEESEADLLLTGMNCILLNDASYRVFIDAQPQACIAIYKNIVGDNYSSSAAGFHFGVKIMELGYVPDAMIIRGEERDREINKILIINYSDRSDWGIVELTKSK